MGFVIRTAEASLGDRQSPFVSSTASRFLHLLLFERDIDAVEPRRIPSGLLEDVIQERDNHWLFLNDMKGRSQKTESKLQAGEPEKFDLIGKVCVLDVKLKAAQAERDSLKLQVGDRALFLKK